MNTEQFTGYSVSQKIIHSPKTILQKPSHKRMSSILSHNDTYNIIQFIGEGAYGEVICCRKRSSNQFVAIKTLKCDSCSAAEVRMLKLLQNVDGDKFHIVKLLEYFHRDAKSYLVFELMEQNLQDFQIANNFAPLPVKHIRTIAIQLLRALEKLKELSIIHTDIKPDNIMLVEHMRFPFRVKVIDFGSASILPEVQHIQDPYIQARYYRSPEILLGLPFCEKLDMWSLGCVLAELRLGSPLYPGKNQYDQIRIIIETQGQPQDHLLNQASKAHLFFKRNSCPQSGRHWQLKSLSECQMKMFAEPLEPRRHTLKSLDELETFSIIQTLFPNGEDIAEFHDRNSMVTLVKRMLNFDPKSRISPRTALRHPFITMEQLEKNYKHTKYFELSVQGLGAALNYFRAENKRNNSHLLQESHNANTVHHDSMQAQPNHSTAFVQRVIDKRDNFTVGKSGKMHGHMTPCGETISPVHQSFTPYTRDARYLPYPYQENCHQISWCVHRHTAGSTPGNLTNLYSSHLSRPNNSIGNVSPLGQTSDKNRITNKLPIAFPSMKKCQENEDNKIKKYSSRSSVTEEKEDKKVQIKETAAVNLNNPSAKTNHCPLKKSNTHLKRSAMKALIRRENVGAVLGFASPIDKDSSYAGTKQHLKPGVHLHEQQNTSSTSPRMSNLRNTKKTPVLIVPEQEQLGSDYAKEVVKNGSRRSGSKSGHISRSEITPCNANKQLVLEDFGEQESEEVSLENNAPKQNIKRHNLGSEMEINFSQVHVNEVEGLEEEKCPEKNSCRIFKLAKCQRRSKKCKKKVKVACWG
ncbi:homeodomain-interacting protein kinase 4-like isoform X1 [Scyliorhinus canicula]|uniref:homeodomain-interacting protein kinase 4-like isoform X1 n=1 Tax=Scyliorhinus canicula TaxID=7830 RepID=UPI0018F70363|nr:homeodomain-interacting protein kinase 4-like isoform X1 [Scyliorhinus canicula]